MNGFLYWSAYNKICETVHMDAAPGRVMNGDANGCGNALAAASRDAVATPEQFVLSVRQFLSTADARTCRLDCWDPSYAECGPGFAVKRFDDLLYVTDAGAETRLAPGMRIAAVGKNTVPFLLKDTAQEIFWGRGTDREDWSLALRMFDDVDVFPGDGSVQRIDLRRYPGEPAAARPTTCERHGNAVVLTVGSLEDADAVAAAAERLRALCVPQAGVEAPSLLVVDLRRCPGEADPAGYLALLPFLCDRDTPARAVMGDVAVRAIYSRNNADLLLAGIERARAAACGEGARDEALLDDLDELAADIAAKAQRVLEAKRAVRGLAQRRAVSELPEIVPSPFGDEPVRVVPEAPRRAVLLVDETTGVGAERLAEAVMGMEKVALAGRATSGAVDYANYVTLRFPEICASFSYPIARTEANAAGHGYARCGLPLDLHVPWTPEECARDVVLERALALA